MWWFYVFPLALQLLKTWNPTLPFRQFMNFPLFFSIFKTRKIMTISTEVRRKLFPFNKISGNDFVQCRIINICSGNLTCPPLGFDADFLFLLIVVEKWMALSPLAFSIAKHIMNCAVIILRTPRCKFDHNTCLVRLIMSCLPLSVVVPQRGVFWIKLPRNKNRQLAPLGYKVQWSQC